ncbi:MAG: class I SAM-dependent methyltransferase [Desulfosarcinaceae bacterium]
MKSSRTRDFSDRLVTILNHGALNLALSIGYRAGIFDRMDTLDAPCSLTQLSARTGVNARYLKEWMGVMVCGGVVELHHDADGEERFLLPRQHGDLLCRRAGNNNLGVYTQEMPLLTNCALEALMADLGHGDGIRYDHYPRFQSFMSQLADAKHRAVLEDVFLPSVDQGRLTAELKKGIRVCDLGCGTGLAVCLMAEAFPASRFTGLDLDPDAVDAGRRTAAQAGLTNASFVCVDVAGPEMKSAYRQQFDYITAFDAIHDQTRPLAALQNVCAMLAPQGAFSMIDIAAESSLTGNRDHPMGAFLYAVSLMHCLPVGLVDGGTGLGMMWGRQKAVALLKEAGFGQIKVESIPNDPFNLHFYCRP